MSRGRPQIWTFSGCAARSAVRSGSARRARLFNLPGTQRQRTIDEIEPVLAPKYFTVQHERRRSEHPEREGFLTVASIERLHLDARLGCKESGAVEAAFIGDCSTHVGVGNVALLGPQRAQNRI